MYRRLDHQLCQIKNYNLTYALFALEPPAVGWGLACHHNHCHRGGTVFQPWYCGLRAKSDKDLVLIRSCWDDVLWLGTVVDLSGCGVLPARNLLDDDDQFFPYCFSCTRYITIRFVEAKLLFCQLIHLYCYVVFIWLSIQTKRKLWRLVSLASGREPS